MTVKSILKKIYKKIFRIKDFHFDLDKEYPCEKKECSFFQLIAIDGIGCSGSSALTDFLAEFPDEMTVWGGVDMYENPDRGSANAFETDFFRNPYSILDMEKICNNRITRLGDRAVNDFIKTVDENYISGPAPLFHNNIYLSATKSFLNNLIDFTVPMGNTFRYIIKKLSIKEYRNYAKDYIKSVLSNIKSKQTLVMDNLISIENADESIIDDYFPENTKIFYVWRDPRDIYAQARLADYEDLSWVPEDPEIFVKWYLKAFLSYKNTRSEKFKCIRFEELVNDYERTTKDIMNYLGISLEVKTHLLKKKFFNPDVSRKNIGIYKKLPAKFEPAISYIQKNLSDYLYNEETNEY